MKMPKLFPIVLLILFLLPACQSAGQEEAFSAADKAEIVQLTLNRALVDQEIPDFGLLIAGGNRLILSSENIEDVEIDGVAGYELVVMSRQEIQAKADSEGDFLYLFFNPFEVETADRVQVSFGSQWAVAKDSTTGYLSGGGLMIDYERQPGGWSGEVTEMWIS